MFTSKYKPKKIEEFIGNKNLVKSFIYWLLEWDINGKIALLSGINGIGKSLFLELLLKKHDYNIIHLSIEEDLDLKDFTKPIIKTKKNLSGQENVLVINDIDVLANESGFISLIINIIKETKIPIICICNDKFHPSLKSLLPYIIDFKFVKPNFDDIYSLIYKVVVNEKIKIKKSEILSLYEESNGDIRFILNTLQLGNRNGEKNIQNYNIFETSAKLFNMDLSIEEKMYYYWMANDLHPLMIQENYITNTLSVKDDVKKIQNISYSADSLSDLDLFDNVFDFDLSPYIAMNAIKSTSVCNKKGMLQFPKLLGKISLINKNKRNKIEYDSISFFEKPTIVPKKIYKKKQLKEKV